MKKLFELKTNLILKSYLMRFSQDFINRRNVLPKILKILYLILLVYQNSGGGKSSISCLVIDDKTYNDIYGK